MNQTPNSGWVVEGPKERIVIRDLSSWSRIMERDGSTVALVPSENEAALLVEAPTMRHFLAAWLAWTDAMRKTSEVGLPDESWLAPIRECIRRSHGRL